MNRVLGNLGHNLVMFFLGCYYQQRSAQVTVGSPVAASASSSRSKKANPAAPVTTPELVSCWMVMLYAHRTYTEVTE